MSIASLGLRSIRRALDSRLAGGFRTTRFATQPKQEGNSKLDEAKKKRNTSKDAFS
jgi:hypothetical protein